MSTYLYVACLDHDPPITAYEESGQHLYDLPQIRADIANRDALAEAWRDDVQPRGYYRLHTVAFLVAHPKCHLGIRDEYDRWHPLVEKADPAKETHTP